MSAFAVVFDRSNTPVQTGVLESVMHRLQHRGPDGTDYLIVGNAAIGHLHFWVTPEEFSERQPLRLDGTPYILVMDGRIDNRDDWIHRLNLEKEEGKRLSDAALMLRVYERWGESCFADILGEFVLVIYDQHKRELVCARDALGDRTLFYAVYGSRIVIASEAWAVTVLDPAGVRLSERAVAHYFAVEAPQDGQSLFEGVTELLPAHFLRITMSREYLQQYWRPGPVPKRWNLTDRETIDEFRALLEEAVRCRLRSITPIGVMMSGGMDSTSVAGLAAHFLSPERLTTLSYVFEEFSECDERRYINAMVERYGLRSIQLLCDDAWPLHGWPDWPHDPNFPQSNPYRLLIERIYARTHQEGMRVLLTGLNGDELYGGEEEILADLIVNGRLSQAAGEFLYRVRKTSLAATLKSWTFRRILRRSLDSLPGGKRLRRKPTSPEWLTPYAIEAGGFPIQIDHSHKQELIFGIWNASGCASEKTITSRHGVELWHPYRDRRLAEFSLRFPAYYSERYGQAKFILHEAMRDVLPEEVQTKSQPTFFLNLLNAGIKREHEILRQSFEDSRAEWRRYVRTDWVLNNWSKMVAWNTSGISSVIQWLCFFYESWYKMYIAN